MHVSPHCAGLRLAGAAALLLALSPVAWGQARQRLAGDVVAVTDAALTIRTAAAQSTTLEFPAKAPVTVRLPASWSDITTGNFVATTAVPQADGTLLAKELRIFPESQRGVGEGHHPMATPGDTMTNATVSKIGGTTPHSTMTNATVTAAAGHRLTLTYKGGEKVVEVPDGTPIMKTEPGDRTLLVPGAHVVVYARQANDGNLAVERVSVGKGSFVPPN